MSTENEAQPAAPPSPTPSPAPAAAPTSPIPTNSDPSPSSGNDVKDIADLLGLQFEDAAKEAEGKPPEPTQAEPGEEGKGEQTTAPAAQPPEVKVPAVEAKPEPSLKDVLNEVLAENRAKPAEAPKVPEQPKTPEAPKPYYTPSLPDAVFAAIEHPTDPKIRKQGLEAVISVVMNKVREDLVAHVEARMSQVPQTIEAVQQRQVELKKTHDNFYAQHPKLGVSDKTKKLVSLVAVQIAQSKGDAYKGMTPEFAAEVANEVYGLLGIDPKAAPTAPQPQTEAKPANPAPKPFVAGSGTRPTGTGEKSLGDEIAETVGLMMN